MIKYIKSNGLVYSLYDIENSALNKNYNERILQVLQLELELAVIQLVIQEKNYFVKKCWSEMAKRLMKLMHKLTDYVYYSIIGKGSL